MSVLVLSDADVRAVLDMPSCIEAMRDALVALERDEAQMPLRFIMRPGTKQVLGLMPAYRGGDRAVFSLKEIVDDLCGPRVMSRLLQGDVGSGKTIVAVQALVMPKGNWWATSLA